MKINSLNKKQNKHGWKGKYKLQFLINFKPPEHKIGKKVIYAKRISCNKRSHIVADKSTNDTCNCY